MALGSQNNSAAWIRSPVLGVLGVWGTRSAEAAVGEELDGHSVEAESNFEILRAQRAQARKGVKTFKDIRENEGVDEDDPLNSIDDGIRLEPFNMRREMREGHFDESGFYVLNKEGEMQLGRRTPTPICAEGYQVSKNGAWQDEEKKVTDAWLDTVDQAERTATFRAAEKQNKALSTAANRISAMAKNLGPDSEGEEDLPEEDKEEGEEDKKEDKETEMKPEEAEAEDKDEDEAKVIDILEELVAFLHPLETPAMALSRVRRGVEKKDWVALKTRARMRQSKAGPAATTTVEREAKAKKRARFNEWGYEEPQEPSAFCVFSCCSYLGEGRGAGVTRALVFRGRDSVSVRFSHFEWNVELTLLE
ncbi:unnamed protein product [Effrenium voratum]|uniref:Uncharacterized protein n=1 Tax=Effrenium voratum TaxID=2562239 RepID=A0AA36IMP7_9DINO|nr:unnamed protein product [Effrenium voratum]